jgi:hypothetical protein
MQLDGENHTASVQVKAKGSEWVLAALEYPSLQRVGAGTQPLAETRSE